MPDNLTSAVVKANRYEPTINEALLDFANHYRTTVIPTRTARPQDKALTRSPPGKHIDFVYKALLHKDNIEF